MDKFDESLKDAVTGLEEQRLCNDRVCEKNYI
jgi:hypothetical protein